MQTIDKAAVLAMYNRAKQLVLTQAWLGRADGLRFAQGSLNALRDLLQTDGPAFVAARDASMGGYRPLAGFEAAWPALPVGAENFTLAQVQDFLRSHGVEISADAVTDSQADAGPQLKDAEVSVVNSHDKHGTARAELNDGPGQHGVPPVVCATVAQGGAA